MLKQQQIEVRSSFPLSLSGRARRSARVRTPKEKQSYCFGTDGAGFESARPRACCSPSSAACGVTCLMLYMPCDEADEERRESEAGRAGGGAAAGPQGAGGKGPEAKAPGGVGQESRQGETDGGAGESQQFGCFFLFHCRRLLFVILSFLLTTVANCRGADGGCRRWRGRFTAVVGVLLAVQVSCCFSTLVVVVVVVVAVVLVLSATARFLLTRAAVSINNRTST